MQNDEIVIWAEVYQNNNTQEVEERTFTCINTGQLVVMTKSYKYIKTISYNGVVWHVYEIINEEKL